MGKVEADESRAAAIGYHGASMTFRFALTAATALTLYSASSNAQPEQIERGKTLFVASCARCHGIEGTGGEGPMLNRPELRNAVDDDARRTVIRGGIRGTDMPGTRHLNAADVAAVAVYVRSLGTLEAEQLPGDVDRGRELFFGEAACTTCHIVDGVGDSLGPNLSKVGARRGSEFLRQHVMDPSDAVPESHLMVRVRTKSGRTLEGMRVNEDAFSIQLRDSENRFHSFFVRDLRELRRLPGKSMMPSYDVILEDEDIVDLVAYLAALRGAS